jgi:hypothetical protein
MGPSHNIFAAQYTRVKYAHIIYLYGIIYSRTVYPHGVIYSCGILELRVVGTAVLLCVFALWSSAFHYWAPCVLPPVAHPGGLMNAFKLRSPPEGGGAGGVVPMSNCLNLWLDSAKRNVKRILANQNYHDVKFYPRSILTFHLQLSVAYKFEIDKFARMWCNSDSNLFSEIVAVKEVFEVEDKDDIVWMAELLSNGYAAENIDRLIYLVSIVKR